MFKYLLMMVADETAGYCWSSIKMVSTIPALSVRILLGYSHSKDCVTETTTMNKVWNYLKIIDWAGKRKRNGGQWKNIVKS